MKTLLALIGALAIIVAIAAAVFLFGGFYSVAASTDEKSVVAWAMGHIRQASIERHASHEGSPVAFNDPAVVQAGARAFSERGCVTCHGAPGADYAKFSEGMHPDPPDLKDIANELSPQHLFWVVKNGINMTGMPSFGSVGVPDDEIWKIVAFVKKLPSVTEDDFKGWTAQSPAGR
ncbi:MAG TPA: cytochrome c [Xanthobacteraceae bacterium]|jgi:mono/diheme cytochrome c family protein